jgi:hypothetical protein
MKHNNQIHCSCDIIIIIIIISSSSSSSSISVRGIGPGRDEAVLKPASYAEYGVTMVEEVEVKVEVVMMV